MNRKKAGISLLCNRVEKCGLGQFIFSSSTWVFSTWGKFLYITGMDFGPDIILGAQPDPPFRLKKLLKIRQTCVTC